MEENVIKCITAVDPQYPFYLCCIKTNGSCVCYASKVYWLCNIHFS